MKHNFEIREVSHFSDTLVVQCLFEDYFFYFCKNSIECFFPFPGAKLFFVCALLEYNCFIILC